MQNTANDEDEAVRITFLDVNQGDCCVIEYGGKVIMIDSGGYSTKEKVENFLINRNIKDIDFAISTHPDEDHFGAFEYLAETVDIKAFYQPDVTQEQQSETYSKLLELLENNDSDVNYMYAEDSLNIDLLQIDVLGPVYVYEEVNEMSLVLRLSFGDFSVLLCGDMAENEIQDIIDSGKNLKSDILKVSHHGSKTGINEEFFDIISPDISVISVGENNYNLPSYEVLNLLEAKSMVLRTDRDGNITVSVSQNSEYIINTERN
ncbi:MAG: MBL fold metallo-hydrolase [Clostridia bacterium]|nr:MBL fold metallo-hydrolase [Clostridia bacterium]